MRTVGVVLLCAFALLTAGCGDLYSLHPLYAKTDQVFDPTIEGRWEDGDDLLVVQRMGDLYQATLQSKKDASETQKYEVHLVDVGGVRFADLLHEDSVGHMFVRTRLMDNELHLTFLDSEWLRKRFSRCGRRRSVAWWRNTPASPRLTMNTSSSTSAQNERSG